MYKKFLVYSTKTETRLVDSTWYFVMAEES